MDKYEFKLSLNEINTLIDERRFDEAAGIADKIDWNRVKSAATLCRISEVYKITGDYDKSREIMAIAYQRQPNDPAIVYALCELTIYLYNRDGMQNDLTASLQLLGEYQKLEPGNPKRHILQYKMYCASPVSDDEKIAVLQQLHEEKPSARWDYELAKLYADSGNSEEAGKAARDVMRHYSGKYADKAADLLDRLGNAEVEPTQEENASEEEVPSENENDSTQETDIERERTAEAERTAAELEETAKQEKAQTEETEKAVEATAQSQYAAAVSDNSPEEQEQSSDKTDLPITTPEEQHGVDNIQNNVANGMKDILAKPYEDKIEQESNGQYAMVTDQPKTDESQIEGQMSISEVMAEWEKIRSDIRKANDQKRAQRILEDTGSLLADFDETARHGLLEDIEKGVARQRRQVRSGAYRVSDALPDDRYGEDRQRRAPQYTDSRNAEREPSPQYYEEDSDNRTGYPVEDRVSGRRPAGNRMPAAEEEREVPAEEDYFDDDETENVTVDQEQPEEAQRVERTEEQEEAPQGEQEWHAERKRPGRRSRRRVEEAPAGRPEEGEIDDIATRRWNSEEIHRAMARQEQLAREEEMENARVRRNDLNRRRRAETAREDADAYLNRRNLEEETDESGEERNGRKKTRRDINHPEYDRSEARTARAAKNADRRPARREEYAEDVERETAGETAQETVYEEPTYEEPAYEEHAEEEPVYEEPVEEPVNEEPAEELQQEEIEEPEQDVPEEEEAEEPDAEENVREESEPESEETETEDAGPEEAEEQTEDEAAEESDAKRSPARKQADGKAGDVQNGKRQLTREEHRLFGPFCRMKENVDQLMEALEQISLASATGNLLILGNEATADRVAKGVLEIERRTDSNFTGKIAKVSGGSLNKLDAEGFKKTFAKLENGALIINRAADIAPKTMERLYQEIEGRDHGVILIMTDGNKKMEQFRRENAKYLESFTAVINIRPLDDKALVAYAKDYANSQDYSIDEFGQLALAQRISTMQTSNHRVTLKEVRNLVDEAIGYASKKNMHTLMEIVSRKRYDENDRIVIHEKDFQHY